MVSLDDERFELVRQVGVGGYGVVYEARDRLVNMRVAIKLLNDVSPDADARFQREVRALALVEHPSIVRYVTHGRTSSGHNYLVMEWLEGCTLADLLEQRALTTSEFLLLARRAVAGLALAEQQGIVHRDIKPANLFLPSGQINALKILDFGLARASDLSQSLTRTGAVIGTPLYMSPEQARGDLRIDPRSDVFSLGSVLYECLAGTSPFATANSFATLAKICFEEPVPLATLRSDASPALCALVHSLLAKAPAARPTYETIERELARIALSDEQAATFSMPDPTSSGQERAWSARASLRPRSEQRVLAAVFIGAAALAPELEQALATALAPHGARSERLLDGARILLFDGQRAAGEQALAAAQCALAMRQVLPMVPFAICTGRAVVDGAQLFGDLFDRGALLLARTAAGQLALDEASLGLLEARFSTRKDADGGYYLERERQGGEAPRTLLGQVTPFVGRERELSQLEQIFQECTEESVARAVLVVAPAGAGKSRLRFELLQRLHQQGEPFELLIGRGDSVRARTPFGLLAPAIREVADIAASDTLERKREKLRARIGRHLAPGAIDRVSEFLGELTGVPFPDENSPHLRAARRDPQLMTDRILASWLEWVDAECRTRAVVFLVEDLHWCDPASVRFLEAALRNGEKQPLFVLGFARPEVRDVFPNLWAERYVQEIRLNKLGARSCERLLAAIGGDRVSPALRTWLAERADGNPFFLEELVRGIGADGQTDRASQIGRNLPDTILGILQARLDALGDEAKLILRAASVFGQTFRVDGMSALLGVHATRIDMSEWLQRLIDREVIFLHGAATDREYSFRHALLREAAYALLQDEERALGHRLAAEWLETQASNEPVLLADHFERGGVPERAAVWYRVATTQALEASSLEDVVRFGERARACGAQGALLGEVASLVAEGLSYGGQDATAWAEVAYNNLEPGVPAWWRASQVLIIAYLRVGSPNSRSVADHMLARTKGPPSLPEQVVALAYAGCSSLQVAQPEIGLQLLQLLEHTDETMEGRPRGCLELARAMLACFHERLGEAVHHARASLDSFQRAGAVRDVAELTMFSAGICCDLGANAEAERLALDAIERGRRLGVQRWIGVAGETLGISYLRQSRTAEAETIFRESATIFARLGLGDCEAVSLGYLALLVAQRGDLEEASALADQALSVSMAAGLMAHVHARVLVMRAQLLLIAGSRSEALAAARAASQLLDENKLTEQAALMRLTYVQCLFACGLEPEARAALVSADAWLRERAEQLDDKALTHAFIADIPEHARLRALAEKWLTPAA